MKILVLFAIILTNSSSFAFDLDEFVEGVKADIQDLIGSKDEPAGPSYEVPPLSPIKNDPKSVDVYKKEGEIYQTGTKFRSLSVRDKAKYHYVFLKELIFEVRGAQATDEELNNYLNVLQQGGNREGIYRSLVVGSSYQQLELYQQKASDRVFEFTQEFGVKYLGVKYDLDKMRESNLWTVKRIFVERALDQMEAFPKDGKDLYVWYAVLSGELASRFAIWRNKLRSNTEPETHIRWAKSVPYQHLKSEVVIKLNKVYNYLQEK